MKFQLISLLSIAVFAAEEVARHGGHGGGDHDGGNGRPCFPGACSTMECCTEIYKRCKPTIDCNGEIVYIPLGWPTRR